MSISSLTIYSYCLLLFPITLSLRLKEDCCSSSQIKQKDLQNIATANNHLGLNLLRQLTSSDATQNIFFSPLSISLVFGMIFYGARGRTAKELRSTLGYDTANLSDEHVHSLFNDWMTDNLRPKRSSEYELKVANMVLVQKNFTLLPKYKSEVQNLYQAPVLDVDFMRDGRATLQRINHWASSKTNGKINHFLKQLNPSTVMMLLNAVYFKGIWETQFSPRNTVLKPFYNGGVISRTKNVPFMRRKGKYLYAETPEYQILDLPYQGGNLSMTIILPLQVNGITSVENNLTTEKFAEIRNNLYRATVDVSLPKFKMEYSREISKDMQSLGAKSIFGGLDADLSAMSASKGLFINKIVHKAVVEVNEEGTEAAAITAAMFVRLGGHPLTYEFKANHPFMFVISDKRSNMILFIGRLTTL